MNNLLNQTKYILPLIIFLFFSFFLFKSVTTMVHSPLYDFDEAHRAENAKRMKEYGSFFVPLTGSGFDRVDKFNVPLRENSDLKLYYHLERPFLVYLLMIASTSFFEETEFFYRLPSFLLGMAVFLGFFFFAFSKDKKVNSWALAIGITSLIASVDLWLSSKYAQLDTSLTFFLSFSLLTLILYCLKRKTVFLITSSISLSLAILSKGQPAIIFVFPFIFLVLIRRLSFLDVVKFAFAAGVILIPWLIFLSYHFGFLDVLSITFGFAFISSSIEYIHHEAPFFWYLRWWLESLRPGFILFMSLFIWDLLHRKLDWQKMTLLIYIFGGLIAFSLSINKIWWYVLPLIPAVAVYIYLSVSSYLEENKNRLLNLSSIIFLGSLPIFLMTTNMKTMIYGGFLMVISLILLYLKIPSINFIFTKTFFILAITLTFLFFNSNFPKIDPYLKGTKEVAQFFSTIPGKKCLWTGEMPAETIIFYSNAGEVNPMNQDIPKSQVYKNCKNYLITFLKPDDEQFKHLGERQVIYQKDQVKLLEIIN